MKVGWILAGNEQTASSRIMCLNVIKYLDENKICENIILRKPDSYNVELGDFSWPNNLQVCIFQKVCWGQARSIMQSMQKQGIYTIYIVDDMEPDYLPMCNTANLVVAGSDYIAQWIREKGKPIDMRIMVDAYETPRNLYKQDYSTDKIKVIWFGNIGHFPQALQLTLIIKELEYEYLTISSCPEATKLWDINTIWNDIIHSDIVVIPYLGQLPPFEMAKGNNRLTQSMVLGLPVIVSPLPAYMSIIKHGRNGILCLNNDEEDWREALQYLGDENVRREMGTRAHDDVSEKYHISTIAKYWKGILHV